MWTATALAPPLQPPIPGPPNAIPPTTKPPLRRRSVAVYNFQNREQMFQAAVIAAVKPSEPQNQSANTKPPAKQELEERRELSGADILMALGKAAAQKTEKKKKKKKKETKKVSTNQGIRDFSRVRPLCIKPEWSDRLQELEERLEELAHISTYICQDK